MPNVKKKRRRLRPGRLILVCAVFGLVLGAIGAGGVLAWKWLRRSEVIQKITDRTAPANQLSHQEEVRRIQQANALDEADVTGFSDDELRSCFYSSEINEDLQARLESMGYTGQIPTGDLRYVRVLYRDYDGRSVVGELIVNAEIATRVENVFYDLYTHRYPIAKMILPDAYGATLADSFADNNTVALCFGLSDDNRGSLHERGYAIDLNPLDNPLIRDNGSSLSVFPMEAQLSLDRTVHAPHYIYNQDYAVAAFGKEGFVWKGDTPGLNDYKHFEYGAAPSVQESPGQQTVVSQQEENAQIPVQQQDPAQQAIEPEQPAQVEEPVYEDPAGYGVQEPSGYGPDAAVEGQEELPVE